MRQPHTRRWSDEYGEQAIEYRRISRGGEPLRVESRYTLLDDEPTGNLWQHWDRYPAYLEWMVD